MKKAIIYSFCLLSLAFLWGCEKSNYPGARVSHYIAIYDVRNLYKGKDVLLTKELLYGSDQITGIVVSDHSGGNLPAGLLVLQDARRLSQLRGISVAIGDNASSFVPGDSVAITVEGSMLKKVNGILQITDLPKNAITKISSGNTVPVNRVPSNLILANPGNYESTLLVIVKGGFNPLPVKGDVLSGDKVLNDGFGELQLHTEANASFANTEMPVLANFYGIVFNINDTPQFRLRKADDVTVLSSTVEVASVLISGFISDVKGADGNYEYTQFLATKDIDFTVTPYSVVVTNNANASTPTGYPSKGWATGSMRTFKFNITSGKATKGTFFYVGGTGKTINGPSSTSIASSNWVRTFNYTTTDGDGFGTKTGGLYANSGNASGVAIFEGTNITVDSKPVDVIFVSNGGSLFTAGPPAQGYRITNTDWYDVKNPITLQDQPFYQNGSNTLCLAYATADLGYFNLLGGEYSTALGRWTKARKQTNLLLTKESAITEIEGETATKLK